MNACLVCGLSDDLSTIFMLDFVLQNTLTGPVAQFEVIMLSELRVVDLIPTRNQQCV